MPELDGWSGAALAQYRGSRIRHSVVHGIMQDLRLRMASPNLFGRNDAAVEKSTTIETYMTPANSKVAYNDRLLLALEKMLAIEVIDVKAALTQTSVILAEATNADKIDIFMFEPSENTLVAMGISPTPMAKRQKQLGLTRLPLANGGREAEVYRTGVSYFSGNVDLDSEALPGFRYELGVRSMIIVPLTISGERVGVIQAAAAKSEAFIEQDLNVMEAVARWVGMIIHKAQLTERLTEEVAEQARRRTADELVTIMAHDLNNYVTPLRGRADLMLRRLRRRQPGDTSPAYEASDVEAIWLATQRLGNIIDDLLDVARLDQGIFTLAPETVDVLQIVTATANALSTATNPIEVDADTCNKIEVFADAGRFKQVLENLLSNAVKHSPLNTPVRVSVSMDCESLQPKVAITVRDRGEGISSEMVDKLFSRFSSGSPSNGLGLGLYVARGIMEAHGGTLEYETAYTEGASFKLEMPILDGCLPS